MLKIFKELIGYKKNLKTGNTNRCRQEIHQRISAANSISLYKFATFEATYIPCVTID